MGVGAYPLKDENVKLSYTVCYYVAYCSSESYNYQPIQCLMFMWLGMRNTDEKHLLHNVGSVH
jgi:hypothetical protein